MGQDKNVEFMTLTLKLKNIYIKGYDKIDSGLTKMNWRKDKG